MTKKNKKERIISILEWIFPRQEYKISFSKEKEEVNYYCYKFTLSKTNNICFEYRFSEWQMETKKAESLAKDLSASYFNSYISEQIEAYKKREEDAFRNRIDSLINDGKIKQEVALCLGLDSGFSIEDGKVHCACNCYTSLDRINFGDLADEEKYEGGYKYQINEKGLKELSDLCEFEIIVNK